MAPSLKIRYNSPVILTYALISLLALALAKFTDNQSNALVFSVYNAAWQDPLTYVRLIGHIFGHADWAHFSSNIMFLLLIGPLLEEKYGSLSLSLIIFVTALITGLIQMFFFQGSLMGASGVVFSFIILTSVTGTDRGGIPLTFLVITGVYLGGEIYKMVAVTDNISQITHIIGGVVGALGGFVLKPKVAKVKSEEKPYGEDVFIPPVQNLPPIMPEPNIAPLGNDFVLDLTEPVETSQEVTVQNKIEETKPDNKPII
ncbi:MAG: rhomboid family intramembrane serine protease [Firmicutes bacterium]|nr:rhomboid family intramembrane serine protease [Bacillota bacterium]